MSCPACGASCPPTARHCPTCGTLLSGTPVVLPNALVTAATTGPLPNGTLLNGRYRIEMLLGQGAFGRVYKAIDTGDPTSPPLAIKELLDTQFTSPEAKREAISWFKREVSTLLSLDHPSIPAIYGYWTAHTTSGPFYLVMEYIPGQTLEQVLIQQGSPRPWPTVVE